MALDRGPLKRLLKENGVNSLDEFNGIMRDIRKEVLGTLVEGKLTNHLGYESDLALIFPYNRVPMGKIVFFL